MNDLKLIINLDGKEAIATITNLDKFYSDLYAKMNKPINIPVPKEVVEKYTKEVITLSSSLDDATNSIAQFISANNINEKEISEVISSLQRQQQTLAIGSNEYQQHVKAIANLNNAYQNLRNSNTQVQGAMNHTRTGAGSMQQAMGQLGYTLGDANMFMVDFRMGLMSVGNNIPIVVEGFMRAKQESAALGTTFKTQLLSSLAGPGGVMIAINALILAVQVLPGLFSKTTDEIKTQAIEVRKLAKEFENLSTTQLENRRQEILTEINILSSKYKSEYTPDLTYTEYDLDTSFPKTVTRKGKGFYEVASDDDKKEMKRYENSLTALGNATKNTKKEIEDILNGKYDTSSIERVDHVLMRLRGEFEGQTTEEGKRKFGEYIKQFETLEEKYRKFAEREKPKTFVQLLEKDIDIAKAKAELDNNFNKEYIKQLDVAIEKLKSKNNLSVEEIELLVKYFDEKDAALTKQRYYDKAEGIEPGLMGGKLKDRYFQMQEVAFEDIRKYSDDETTQSYYEEEMEIKKAIYNEDGVLFTNHEEIKTAIHQKYERRRAEISRREMRALNVIQETMAQTLASNIQIFLSNAFRSVFGEANSLFEQLILNVTTKLTELAISNAFTSIIGLLTGGAGGAAAAGVSKGFLSILGFATGGVINGKGTDDSDDNLIRVSNNEYVVNAKAAKKNMALLDAINSGASISGFGNIILNQESHNNNSKLESTLNQLIEKGIRAYISDRDFNRAANDHISKINKYKM